jgi:hypothetical protein
MGLISPYGINISILHATVKWDKKKFKYSKVQNELSKEKK